MTLLSGTPTHAIPVYLALRRAIVHTELLPGDRIDDREIADAFGWNRSTVRAAVGRLRRDGLVTGRPSGVATVALFRLSALQDAQFLREALECAAVRIAASRVTADDLRSLERILSREADSLMAGNLERAQLLDVQFHRALCELSGRDVWCMTHHAGVPFERIRRLGACLSPAGSGGRTERHARIIEALEAREPDVAADVLRDDLRTDVTTVNELRLRCPGYFVNC